MYSYDGVNMKPPSRVENEACGVKCLLHKLVHCAVACCYDRTSSTYADTSDCIVFLSDVPSPKPVYNTIW